MSKAVYVSGASGFIAQHIVKDLIAKGYTVVGSVRSSEKGDQLAKNLKSDNFSYEIVKDIAEPNAFDESLKKHPEVEYFMHTASPFHFNTTDIEKDLLIPAIEGTKNALKSIKAYGSNVKRVIVTSSVAALYDFTTIPEHVDEKSWTDMPWDKALSNPVSGYIGSKTYAEKAAWEFMEQEKPNFTLNTVNPVYVFGPQAFTSGANRDVLNTSSELISGYAKLTKDDAIPETSGNFVDVRDVSKLHIYAIEHDVKDFRYFATSAGFDSQDVVDLLNAKVPQLKGKLPVGKPGTGKGEFYSSFIDNTKTKELYGEFISFEKSILDSVNQLL